MTNIPDELNEGLKGPWLHKSISEQRKEFAKWLEAGNRPDDHPLVRPVGIRPPEGVTPETIAEVELKSSYRRQDRFHCNDCGTKLKFKGTGKETGQIMSFGDGWLYCIGPDCGDAHQLEMKRQGLRDFRRILKVEQSIERLLTFRSEAETWQAALETAKSAGDEALRFQMYFKSATRLHERLVQCRKDQGKLWYQVRERRPDYDPDKHWEEYQTATKEFPVKIGGLSLFEIPSPVLASIKELGSILSRLDVKNAMKPHWLESMQTTSGEQIALSRADLLPQLSTALDQCSSQIKSAQAFFDVDNLAALNEWIKLDKSLRASMRVDETNFKLVSSELPDGQIAIQIESLLNWT